MTLHTDNRPRVTSWHDKTVFAELIRVDEPTANGVVYPRGIIEREIARMNALLEAGTVFGEYGVPKDNFVDLRHVSHKMTSIRLAPEDKAIQCVFEVLDTPSGQELTEAIKDNRARPLMMGFCSKTSTMTDPEVVVVPDDYTFASVSFVESSPCSD